MFTLHCACALRIPDSIYITTQSSIDVEEAAAAESGINTELVAPEASNLNQFYQQQSYPPTNFFQQPPHQPFLYMGPLILTEDPRISSHQNDLRNTERNSVSQEKNSYKLYRPSPEDNPQFVDMLPPSETQEEPNYYLSKPKKNKKYSEKDHGENKKSLKKKQVLKKNILENEVFEKNEEEKQSETSSEVVNSSESSNEYQARRQRETSSTKEDYDEEPVEESQPASRLDFAMHGN